MEKTRNNLHFICIEVRMLVNLPWNKLRHESKFREPPRIFACPTSADTANDPRSQESFKNLRSRVVLVVGLKWIGIEIWVSQDVSRGGFTVRGSSMGGTSIAMRRLCGSCSGRIVIVLKCTDTRSNRRTLHLPMLFHKSFNRSSSGLLPIPIADPASIPICPPTFNHMPPSSVMFNISTRLGPTKTKSWFMISSGVKCDALDAYDQANRATITNNVMHTDREARKMVVSCDRSRRCEVEGNVMCKSSAAREEDPKRGDRSVGSCALRLPLSTWLDNCSLLIVGGQARAG